MRFFRRAPFSGATALAVGVFTIQGGFLFLNTLYLQQTRGLSPLQAGLDTLPMAIPLLFMAPITGRFVGVHGARLPLLAGAVATTAGALMLTQLAPTTSMIYLFGAYVLIGLGMGLFNPPITNTAVSGMPPSMAGVAAAVASTARQGGSTLGVAVFGALAGSRAIATASSGFASETHPAWWVAVGIGAVLFTIAFATTTPWAHRTAQRAAELIEEETSSPPPSADAQLVAH
jgi:MFS family permease